VGDRAILEGDVELGGAAEEVGTDTVGDSFTLGDEFGGIELCDDGLEDFVSDRGKNTLIIILTEVLDMDSKLMRLEWARGGKGYLVDLGEGLDFGTVQDSESQADHLQILGTGGGGDVARLCADVVDDALLQPGNEEVSSLAHNAFLDTRQAVEDDGASAALDIVHGGICEGQAEGGGNSPLVDGTESVGGHDYWILICSGASSCRELQVGAFSLHMVTLCMSGGGH
jgi:hypothetical protein